MNDTSSFLKDHNLIEEEANRDLTNEFNVSFSKELAIATQTGGLHVVDEGFKHFSDAQDSFCTDFNRGLANSRIDKASNERAAEAYKFSEQKHNSVNFSNIFAQMNESGRSGKTGNNT